LNRQRRGNCSRITAAAQYVDIGTINDKNRAANKIFKKWRQIQIKVEPHHKTVYI